MDDEIKKPKRKPLSKKVRFEVFKRDSFSCQYCGASAPDVLLHVDHIKPVSKGGTNRITNLITSCQACNAGKSDRELSDTSVVSKQKAQIDALQERREQIEMIMAWHEGMVDIEAKEVDSVAEYLQKQFGVSLTDHGKKGIKKHIKKHGLMLVLKGIDSGAETYGTGESINTVLDKLGGICACIADPQLAQAVHVRSIIKKRYWTPNTAVNEVLNLIRSGLSYGDLKNIAYTCRGWDSFMEAVEDL